MMRGGSNDPIGALAGVITARVAPSLRKGDRANADDIYQTAYATGLMCQASAARAGNPTSSDVILLAMQSAVYRLLSKGKGEIRESDVVAA